MTLRTQFTELELRAEALGSHASNSDSKIGGNAKSSPGRIGIELTAPSQGLAGLLAQFRIHTGRPKRKAARRGVPLVQDGNSTTQKNRKPRHRDLRWQGCPAYGYVWVVNTKLSRPCTTSAGPQHSGANSERVTPGELALLRFPA
jgi:hypothetical protein